jgi:hypothetical protein
MGQQVDQLWVDNCKDLGASNGFPMTSLTKGTCTCSSRLDKHKGSRETSQERDSKSNVKLSNNIHIHQFSKDLSILESNQYLKGSMFLGSYI